MKKLHLLLVKLVKEESGQDLIEYALVASIVGLAAITTLGTLASEINQVFTTITGKLTTAVSAAG